MVSYTPLLHRSAERELSELPTGDQKRLKSVLQDVAHTREPTQHKKVRELEGQAGLFRVRVGNLRAICTLEKPDLLILKVSPRQDAYENIDAIDDRLEAVA